MSCSAMSGILAPCRISGAHLHRLFTVGTVGPGPKAWAEVAAAVRGGGSGPVSWLWAPTGARCPTCTASNTLSVAVGHSLLSRSAEAATRLETRTKESNMCTSHWVD